jgi:hypothetical protein
MTAEEERQLRAAPAGRRPTSLPGFGARQLTPATGTPIAAAASPYGPQPGSPAYATSPAKMAGQVAGVARDGLNAALPGTMATLTGSGEDAASAARAGNYGAAAGHVLRGAIASPVAVVDDVVGQRVRSLAPVAAGVGNAVATAVTGDNAPVFGAAPAPAARAAGTAKPAGAYAPFEAGYPAAAPAPVGAARTGAPLFSNAGAADDQALMARGAVSPQNMAAADNLAARYDGSAQRQVQAQYDKEVADAAFTNAQQGFGAGGALSPRETLNAQLSARKLTAKGAGVVADLARTDATREATAATNRLGARRVDIEAERLGMDKGKAAALQAAEQAYLNADTPEKKQAAGELLTTLQGRSAKDPRFTVVPGGQEVVDGQSVTRPARVLNNQTGQFVDQQPAGAPPKFEPGKVYQDASGKKAKWDGAKFVPI